MTLEFSLEMLNGKDALVQAPAGLPGVLCPGDGHPGRLGHHGRRHHLHLSGGRGQPTSHPGPAPGGPRAHPRGCWHSPAGLHGRDLLQVPLL